MLPLPPALPLAELEVGKHLYWQLGNLKIHGQVFLSSWVVIGALLTVVWIGTRKMDRDPRGVQNLLDQRYALPVVSEVGAGVIPQYGRTFWLELGATF